uniref:Uncharacterized protein n=1 Tax=Oryza brachyantha TaxID=4533 RepID=J3NBY2_ORYBR
MKKSQDRLGAKLSNKLKVKNTQTDVLIKIDDAWYIEYLRLVVGIGRDEKHLVATDGHVQACIPLAVYPHRLGPPPDICVSPLQYILIGCPPSMIYARSSVDLPRLNCWSEP